MDRYRRIEKPKVETPIEENEIRITSQGRMRNYITYAMSLLQDKGSNEIVFKAMGRAINKTVTIVELIKRRIIGVHQVTSICSTDITDNWEPIEEGLNPVETTRHVSMITITLSKVELDTSSIGYQAPLPADQVRLAPEFDYEGEDSPNGFRGRGRGGRGRGGRSRGGNGFIASAEHEDGSWDRNRGGYGRGRGRGRGRGFRGRGRGGGGYNNNNGGQYDDNQQGDGGYGYQEPSFQGRGRGGYNGGGQFDNNQQGGGGGYNDEPSFQQGGGGYNGRGSRGGGGYNGGGQFDNNNQQGGGGYNREPSFQGRGRGGYNGGGGGGDYNQEPSFQGRGRGRGRGYRGGRGRGGGGGGGFRSNGPMIHTAAGGA